MTLIVLIALLIVVVDAAARRYSQPERNWEEVRQTVIVERMVEWAHLRSGSRQAITETEKRIREMSEKEFVELVASSLRNAKLHDEAQVVEKQYETRRKEASPLLREWEVSYRKN